MKKDCNPLIYSCFDNIGLRNSILNECDNIEIKNHIEELYNLIRYQMVTIHEQRAEIIAFKHKTAWKNYDTNN